MHTSKVQTVDTPIEYCEHDSSLNARTGQLPSAQGRATSHAQKRHMYMNHVEDFWSRKPRLLHSKRYSTCVTVFFFFFFFFEHAGSEPPYGAALCGLDLETSGAESAEAGAPEVSVTVSSSDLGGNPNAARSASLIYLPLYSALSRKQQTKIVVSEHWKTDMQQRVITYQSSR